MYHFVGDVIEHKTGKKGSLLPWTLCSRKMKLTGKGDREGCGAGGHIGKSGYGWMAGGCS